MENDLPTHLFSPGCSDDFAIVGGAGFELDTRGGFDVVELRGAGYSFREVEGRRMANGFHEEEPRSILPQDS